MHAQKPVIAPALLMLSGRTSIPPKANLLVDLGLTGTAVSTGLRRHQGRRVRHNTAWILDVLDDPNGLFQPAAEPIEARSRCTTIPDKLRQGQIACRGLERLTVATGKAA